MIKIWRNKTIFGNLTIDSFKQTGASVACGRTKHSHKSSTLWAEPTSVQWGWGQDCWPLYTGTQCLPGASHTVSAAAPANHLRLLSSLDNWKYRRVVKVSRGGSQPRSQAAHVELISGECKVCTALTFSVQSVTSSLPTSKRGATHRYCKRIQQPQVQGSRWCTEICTVQWL